MARDNGMVNPVLLTAGRGDGFESEHRGAYCVLRGSDVVAQAGDVDAPVFVRSGAKWLQALPGLLAGAVERFGLEDRHLALMCASHGGEPEHVAAAAEMLERAGIGAERLGCGAHAPLHSRSAFRLRAAGEEPTVLHNNCSGKHAGMLLAARARGEQLDGYLDVDHPLQRAIHDLVQDLAEVDTQALTHAVDGCSAPTWVLPLIGAARAFKNHGTPASRLGPAVADAASRLHAAVAHDPHMVGGTDRFCSALVRVTSGRVLGKVGAEGFYGVMIPGADVGVALHVDSGAWQASERIMPHLLHRHGLLTETELAALDAHAGLVRRNWAGHVVGHFQVHL